MPQKKMIDLFYFIEEKEFIRGQYIYEEGQEVDGVYFLTQGELTKMKNLNTTPTQQLTINLESQTSRL